MKLRIVVTAIIINLILLNTAFATDTYLPPGEVTTDQTNTSIEYGEYYVLASNIGQPPLASDPGYWFTNLKLNGILQDGDYITINMKDWQGNLTQQDFYSLPIDFNPSGEQFAVNFTLHTSSTEGWRQVYWVSVTNNYGDNLFYETPSPPDGGGGGDTTPPQPPGDIGADRGNQWLMIYWTPSSSSDVDGYNIYVDGELKATYAADATQGYVSGLMPDTTYNVEVTAFDAAGNESTPISKGISTVHFVKDVDLMEYLTNPPPVPEPPEISQISIPPAPVIDVTVPSYTAPEINIPPAAEFDPEPPEYSPPQGGGAYTYEPPDFDVPEPIPSPDPLPAVPDPSNSIMEGAQPVQEPEPQLTRSNPVQRDNPTTAQQPLEKEAAGTPQTPITPEPAQEQTTGYTPEPVKTTTGLMPENALTPSEALEPSDPLLPSDPL